MSQDTKHLWRAKKEAGDQAVSDFANLNNHTSPRTYPPIPDEQTLSYKDKPEASRKLLFERQLARYEAEEIFFNPTDPKNVGETWKKDLAEPLRILARQRWLKKDDPLPLTGKSAHYLIMVQRMYAERLIELRGIREFEQPENFESWRENYNPNGLVMHERYELDSTTILCAMKIVETCDKNCRKRWCMECKRLCFEHNKICVREIKDLRRHKKYASVRWRRLRFGWVDYNEKCGLEGYISYENIYDHLSSLLTTSDHYKAFARVMIDLAHGQSLTDELIRNSILPQRCQEGEVLEFFRHFFFHCFVMEPASWLSASYSQCYRKPWTQSSRFKAGLAVSFARAMILLRDGKITLEDVFSYSGEYNPFVIGGMNDDSWAKVEKKCATIDDAYERNGRVTSRDQALRDLEEVFGRHVTLEDAVGAMKVTDE